MFVPHRKPLVRTEEDHMHLNASYCGTEAIPRLMTVATRWSGTEEDLYAVTPILNNILAG